jgi:two-component system cell cycle sensor histidine kinase PleC
MTVQNTPLRSPVPSQKIDARLVADGGGRIVFVTPDMAEMLHIPSASATGRLITDILTFSDPDSALRPRILFGVGREFSQSSEINEGTFDVFVQGKAGKTSFHFTRVMAKDGHQYIVGSAVSGAMPEPESGFVERALQSTMPDDLHKISTSSADTELRHFLNMSHDVMAVCGLDGTFHRVNSTFNAHLGYSDAELRQMSMIDLVHENDRLQMRPILQGMMQDDKMEGRIVDCEARVIGRDKQAHWMDWRIKRANGRLYCVGREISAIKEHEEALIKKEQMLSEAEMIGRMGHWRWDVGAENVDWSDEIYRIFGVERDRFHPTMDSVNAKLHRRDAGRMMQAFQRAIIEGNDYEMEFRINRPDGAARYIRCEGRCEKDSDGDVVALYGIMQDMTERTLYEENLREAKDAAERAYAARTQFLANMSHELRTPLNAIIGFSEMMQRQLLGPIGNDRYNEYISGIRESGEHLLDLISDILDMAKIEAGKYELALEELNVAKTVRLSVHMMEGRALDAQVRVKAETVSDGLTIVADRRAVLQILLNLLSNAVKFTNPGGSVTVECLEREDHIILKVQDTGIGIPANKLKSVTRPFEQVSSHYTREHDGTGLGLAITKELAELHGGSLHIDSVVGVGTTVAVRLPRDSYQKTKG